MKNKIGRTYPEVIEQMNRAIAGVQAHATSLSLTMVTAPTMTTTLTELIGDNAAAMLAKNKLGTRQTTFRTLLKDGRNFIYKARDVLKPHLGRKGSPAWELAGFAGSSLMVPSRPDKVKATLLSLNSYFTENPTHENVPLNVTAAAAQTFYDDLVAGKGGLDAQETALKQALIQRDAKAEEVRDRVRALIKELSVKLDPMDARWTSFGFNKPGLLQTPEVPDAPTATLQNATTLLVKWGKVARGKNYRVWIKVQGTHEEFQLADSTAELNYTLEGLTPGATIEIAVSASNNGGESQRSEARKVILA